MNANYPLKWLKQYCPNVSLLPIFNDASNRQYFRTQYQGKNYVLMDSSAEISSLKKFLTVYEQIKSAIYVPKIYQYDTESGYLLLEDLGNTTLLDTQNPTNLTQYQQALDDLISLQSLTTTNLPIYNNILLRQELELFPTWYLRQYQQYQPNSNEMVRLNEVFEMLISQILTQPQVVTHRDYHSRNIMITAEQKLAYIDFQDTVIGAYSYDICSLLKDAYYQLNLKELSHLLNYFYIHKKLKHKSYEAFIFDVDINSIQRQLKVLGIFARLAIRDNKQQYLENIPLVKSYLLATLKKYPDFTVLTELIEQ